MKLSGAVIEATAFVKCVCSVCFGFYEAHRDVTLAIGVDRKGGFGRTNPRGPQHALDEVSAVVLAVFLVGA